MNAKEIMNTITNRKGVTTMTKKTTFETIADILSTNTEVIDFVHDEISINDLIEFCHKEAEKLNKPKAANKKRTETETIAMEIYDAMEDDTEYTLDALPELMENLVGLSTSKLSSYMRVLKDMGLLTKGKIGKKVAYKKANEKE